MAGAGQNRASHQPGKPMRLWICGNDLHGIADWISYGVFEGILTNPDIIAAADSHPDAFLRKLCELSAGPVYYQLKAGDEETMMNNAQRALSLDPKIRIKAPATREGLRTIARLTQEGHEVLATCIADLATLLMAVHFGARRVTPYGSIWHPLVQVDKESIISEFQSVIDRHKLGTELIVGVKTPLEMRKYAMLGVESFFIWVEDLNNFFNAPMVLNSEKAFRKSWEKLEHPRV